MAQAVVESHPSAKNALGWGTWRPVRVIEAKHKVPPLRCGRDDKVGMGTNRKRVLEIAPHPFRNLFL
jgi:hypothetical protein